MPFKSVPILRVSSEYEWTLETPLWYVTHSGEDIIVSPGFGTDLASIPRLFHSIVPVNGKHRAAAIVHDWLYVQQDRTRADADRIFLEAMDDLGVRWSQRWAMYAAVRVGGWMPWNRRAVSKEKPG